MRTFLAILVLLSFSSFALSADLRLVPTPQKVEITQGVFRITPAVQINGEPFLVQQITDEIKNDFSGPNVGDGDRGTIELVKQMLDGFTGTNRDEAYELTVTPGKVTIAANTDAGLFYGVQTLKQLFRANSQDSAIPCCRIVDWPKLKYRGWQDDISRGPIPTLDYFKREIRVMSEVKENLFTLYTEHVFKLKKHPGIAPDDGISAEEIAELVAYGKQYHVEVAGNYQSFGHQAHLLSLPKYQSLGANAWALNPASEATYQFLADVYDEIAAAYPSELFVISCDEVGGFEGTAADAMLKKLGPGKLYTTHINRVVDLLRGHKKTAMMWGDIAMQHPENINELPKDLIVLPWTYGDNGNFDRWVKPYADRGYKFIVCPGASCWSHIWPNIDNAVANISDFTRDGAKFGALGQMNTTWRDDGETLFGYDYYPLLWGAECAWSPVDAESSATSHEKRNARQAQFDNAYDGVFYGLAGKTFASANRTLGSLGGILSDQTTWRDAVAAWTEDDTASSARAVSAKMQGILADIGNKIGSAKYNRDTLKEMMMQCTRIALGAEKVATVDLLARHPMGDRVGVSDASIKILVTMDQFIKAQFIRNWNAENHPWWLDQNLPKFDALEKSVKELPTRTAITPARAEFTGKVEVRVWPLGQGEPRYTLDGSEPKADSPLFTKPIVLNKTTKVRARQVFADGKMGPVTESTYNALAIPAKVTTKMPVHEGNVPNCAFDGSADSFFWSSSAPKVGATLNITLDTPAIYKTVTVTTGHPTLNRDTLEHGVVEISTDGKEFQQVAEFQNGTAKGNLPNQAIKVVRVRVTGEQSGWLAIREVELK